MWIWEKPRLTETCRNGVEIVVDGGGHLKQERKVVEQNAKL